MPCEGPSITETCNRGSWKRTRCVRSEKPIENAYRELIRVVRRRYFYLKLLMKNCGSNNSQAIKRGCRAYQPVVARGSELNTSDRRSAIGDRPVPGTVQQREALADDRGCRPMIATAVIPCVRVSVCTYTSGRMSPRREG